MDRFDELLALHQQRSLPPVHLWEPERIGEIDIHIDAQGVWFHEGDPIQRQPLVNLFATILRKDAADYYLVTPVEKLKIRVDDVPFMATDMEVRGTGEAQDLLFTTNVGDVVVADASHPLQMRGEKPYLMVRDGLEALLTRPVFYRLVDLCVEEGVEEGVAEGVDESGTLVVYSQGARFALGSTH